MTRLYLGTRTIGGTVVTADGVKLPLRTDLANHSPSGFEWGYGGSGPAQLALAILADHFGDGGEDRARELHQRFKWDVIATLKADEWAMTTADVGEWLRRAGEPLG